MWKWLVWALMTASAQAAALRGAVVDNQSGRPLGRSLVVLQPVAGTPGTVQSARTDGYGAFDFPSLPAGAYLLSASRRSFAPIQYGQKRWKGSGVPVVLAESSIANISIRLPRFGGISGIVSDETDVGMPGVFVAVYRNTRPPILVGKAETDDRGAYRLGGLEPGSYLVRTMAAEDGDASWVPTFSPDHPRVEGARPAEVVLDRETTLVNLRPIRGRLYTVTGRIPDSQRSGATVTLTSDMGTEVTSVDASGTFRFKPGARGPYELAAVAPEDRRNPVRVAWAAIQVDAERDYRLSLGAMPEMQVAVEDGKGQLMDLATVSIVARRKDLTGTSKPSVLRIADGKTTMPPGRWELSLSPGPDQYVASFTGPSAAPGRRADGWNEIVIDGSGPATVKFGLAANPGAIHGIVTREADVAAPGAPVFLEAFDRESGKRLVDVRMTRTDVRGQYQFTGLVPGHYRVVSSYDLDDPNRAAMDEAGANTIVVEQGRNASANLRLFTAP